MLLIPAIDLLDGNCVRLLRGEYERKTIYAEDPIAVALNFQAAGAKLIHLVDLNRARGEAQGNLQIIKALAKKIKIPLELGGGLRSAEDIKELMDAGIRRLIIGTAIVSKQAEVRKWLEKIDFYPIAALDAFERVIKIDGWTENSAKTDTEIASLVKELGFKEIIYTNISKDGTLSGPDIASTNEIAEIAQLPTILSGGIGNLTDLTKVDIERHPLIKGVIVGKAIYEKKISLLEAISLYQHKEDEVKI